MKTAELDKVVRGALAGSTAPEPHTVEGRALLDLERQLVAERARADKAEARIERMHALVVETEMFGYDTEGGHYVISDKWLDEAIAILGRG